MRLPNADQALVSESKVKLYLLNSEHRVGGSKAAFFRQFGFVPDHWEIMAAALQRHAQENEVFESEATRFGTRYAIDGPLQAPDGTILNVRTAWFIDDGSVKPRFVTAHPLEKR